jgi:hypothetical protein
MPLITPPPLPPKSRASDKDRMEGMSQLQNFFTLVDVKTTVDIALPKFLRLDFEKDLVVQEKIGTGGSGDVCKGTMNFLNHQHIVAIKYVRGGFPKQILANECS